VLNSIFRRHVEPLTASEIAYLRVWLRTTSEIPPPPYVGATPPTPEQALLLLSLTYGAGLRPSELAALPVSALLDDQGLPSAWVRIPPEATKHRVSRRCAMHPDIRRDLGDFRSRHRSQQWVAFLCSPNRQSVRMSEHGLSRWFQQLFRSAALSGLSARSGVKAYSQMQRGN
jgi:hypothetical protein